MIYGIEDICIEYLETKIKLSLKQSATIVKQNGLQEDKLESQLEFARTFIRNGIPEDVISNVLGIDEENIKIAKKSILN